MQRFYVTAVNDKGYRYYLANYPSQPREVGGGKWKQRKQKKFSVREEAEAFIEEARREWMRGGGVELAYDREFHYDALRAAEALAGTPGLTLWKAAVLLKGCASWREYKGLKFEAPRDRTVELSPRIMMAVQVEAKAHSTTLAIAAEGLIGEWLLMKANREIMAQVEKERVETAQIRELRLVYEELRAEQKKLGEALRRARRSRDNARQQALRYLRKDIEEVKRLCGLNGFKISIQPLEENADGNSDLQ